jgi:hypothetical protein
VTVPQFANFSEGSVVGGVAGIPIVAAPRLDVIILRSTAPVPAKIEIEVQVCIAVVPSATEASVDCKLPVVIPGYACWNLLDISTRPGK